MGLCQDWEDDWEEPLDEGPSPVKSSDNEDNEPFGGED